MCNYQQLIYFEDSYKNSKFQTYVSLRKNDKYVDQNRKNHEKNIFHFSNKKLRNWSISKKTLVNLNNVVLKFLDTHLVLNFVIKFISKIKIKGWSFYSNLCSPNFEKFLGKIFVNSAPCQLSFPVFLVMQGRV